MSREIEATALLLERFRSTESVNNTTQSLVANLLRYYILLELAIREKRGVSQLSNILIDIVTFTDQIYFRRVIDNFATENNLDLETEISDYISRVIETAGKIRPSTFIRDIIDTFYLKSIDLFSL